MEQGDITVEHCDTTVEPWYTIVEHCDTTVEHYDMTLELFESTVEHFDTTVEDVTQRSTLWHCSEAQ